MAQMSGSIALDTSKLVREIREELGAQLAPSLAELHAKVQALTEVVDNMASELAARGLMEEPGDVVIRDPATMREVMRIPVTPVKVRQVDRPSWDEGLDRAASRRADQRLAEENAGVTDSWVEDA